MNEQQRLIYLADIAAQYIRKYAPDQTIIFDDAECDGTCLADDLEIAIRQLA